MEDSNGVLRPPQLDHPAMVDYLLQAHSKTTCTEKEVKKILCTKYPEFRKLKAKVRHNHARAILKQLELRGKVWIGKWRVPMQVDDKKVAFIPDSKTAATYLPNDILSRSILYSKPKPDLHRQFEYLQQLYKDPQSTWLIDTEFVTLMQKIPIVFSISIRTMTGKPLLHTLIDYNSTIDEMFQEIKPWLATTSDSMKIRVQLFKNTFTKHYGNRKTQGKTITEVRSDIHKLGYTADHTLLSWASVHDIQIFQRIIEGSDAILADRSDDPVSNCVNLLEVCKHMRPEASFSELRTNQLSDVHSLLLPDLMFNYHDAHYDTLALAQIVHMIIHAK